MKNHIRITTLLLLVCLCITALCACGVEEPAADVPAATTIATAPSTNTDSEYTFDSMVAAMQEIVVQAQGFVCNMSANGIGTVDGTALEFSSDYSRNQPAGTDNLFVRFNSSAETTDDFFYSNYEGYYTDGIYYCKDVDNFHLCTEPTVSPIEIPGQLFLDILAHCEKTQVDDKTLSCTFTLTGGDLKAVVEELFPNLSSEIAPSADWSSISADFSVDLSEYRYFEQLQVSSPSLGAQLLQSSMHGSTVACTEFSIDFKYDYKSTFVDTPYKPEDAVPGNPTDIIGLGRVVRTVLGQQEETEEIANENAIAETFESVTIIDHESTLPYNFESGFETESIEPAPTLPTTSDENTITLTSNGKTVLFSFPSEIKHYDKIKQDSPSNAIMVHDIFTGVNGRTIIEMFRGTPEEYIGSYLRKDLAETETVTMNGRELLVWKKKDVIKVEKGTTRYDDEYVFSTALGDTMLGFRVEVSYDENSTCEFDDSIIEILMNHCTFQ